MLRSPFYNYGVDYHIEVGEEALWDIQRGYFTWLEKLVHEPGDSPKSRMPDGNCRKSVSFAPPTSLLR